LALKNILRVLNLFGVYRAFLNKESMSRIEKKRGKKMKKRGEFL